MALTPLRRILISLFLGLVGTFALSHVVAQASSSLPSAPASLAAGGCSTTANLLWDAAVTTQGTISNYSIQYSSNDGSTWSTFSRTPSTTTSAAITGLTSGGSYRFRVAAITQHGTGEYATTESIVIGPSTIERPCYLQPALKDQYFRSVTASTDGTTIATGAFRVVSANGGTMIADHTISRSSNSGSSWTKVRQQEGLDVVAGSPDGTCYLAGTTGAYMYPMISKNSGSTWTSTQSARVPQLSASPYSFAIGPNCTSATATYAVASDQGIFLSINGGSLFEMKNSGSFAGIAMSTTTTNVGDRMVVGLESGRLMFTTNRGQTWANSTGTGLPIGTWGNIVMSPNGMKVAAVLTGRNQISRVWISTNGGASFSQVNPYGGSLSRQWTLAAARDGSDRLIATATGNGNIAYSGDWGSTWSTYFNDGAGFYKALACNGDCSKLYGVDSEGLKVLTVDAKQMTITRPAQGAASGVAFDVQPQITMRNAFNERLTSENSAVVTASPVGNRLNGTLTATASGGIVTFANLGLTAGVGANAFGYSSPGFETIFQDIDMNTGPASKVIANALSESGTAYVSGLTLQFPISVALSDDYGNVVTSNSSMTISMSISSGGSILGETAAVLSNGIATFNSIGFRGSNNRSYNVTFSGTGVTSFVTSIVTRLGDPTKLTVIRRSSGTAAGAAFTTQPQIAIQDAAGNTLISETRTVLATVSRGASLVGTRTVQTVNGIATLPSDFGISGTAGTTYTVTYSTENLDTASETVTVTTGAPYSVTVLRDAAGAKSGAPFITQPIAALTDRGDNVVTGDNSSVITATISLNGTQVASGQATVSSGVATFGESFGFSGIAGTTYTIVFTSTSASLGDSQTIIVDPGLARTAHLTTQSQGTTSGELFTTQPVVTLKDAQGNVVTNDNSTVVTVYPQNGLLLTGNRSFQVTNGIASFSGLRMSGPSGGSFTLTYSAPGTTADSQTVVVSVGPAYTVQRATAADGAKIGTKFAQQPVYRIVDSFGNLRSSDSSTVLTASVIGCSTCMSGETATARGGIVAFSNLTINRGSQRSTGFTVSAPSVPISFNDTVNLSKADPVLTGDTSFAMRFGDVETITTATASTPGTFSYTSASSRISVSGNRFTAIETGTALIIERFTPADTSTYNSTLRELSFIVLKAIPTISAENIQKTFGDSPFLFRPNSFGLPGTFTYTSNNPGVLSISGETATVESAGRASITVTFTPTDTSRYLSTTAIVQATISRAIQNPLVISTTLGRFGSTLTLSTTGGSSGGVVTYQQGTDCTLNGSSLSVSSAGKSCFIQATMPGGNNYGDVSSNVTEIFFDKAIQGISVTKPSDRRMSVNPFTISASSNFSGANLTFSTSPSSVCTNSSETITMVSQGRCTITINSGGSANWETATAASVSFEITGKADVIVAGIFNFSGNPGTTQNMTFSATKNTLDQDVPGTFTFTVEDPLIATIDSSNVVTFGSKTGLTQVTALFTPNDTAIYNTGVVSFSITTTKQSQPVLRFNSSSVVYGTTHQLSVTGGAGTGAVVYRVSSGSCTVTGSLLIGTALGTCVVTAVKEADQSYAESSVSGNILVTVKDAKMFTPSFNIKYGETIPTVNPTFVGLVAQDSVSGISVVQYSGINGTIYGTSNTPPTAPGTYSMTPLTPVFTSGSLGSYMFEVETGVLTISKLDQVITFSEIGDMAYRATELTLNPTVNSSLSVTLTSSTTGICSLSGFVLTINAIGTCTLEASQAGDTNHNAAVSVTRSFQITGKARPILGTFNDVTSVFGVPRVSFTAPTSNVSGTLTYSTSNNSVVSLANNETTTLTIVAPGTSVIVATLTPDSTSLYETVTESMTVTISKAAQSLLEVSSTTKFAGETHTVVSSGGSGTGLLTYQVTSGSCTFTGAVITSSIAQSCAIRVTKAADSNYEEVSGNAVVVFDKRTQSISFSGISNRIFSPTPFTITLPTVSSGAVVTVTSETTGVCTLNGAQITIITQGLCTLKASAAESSVYQAAQDVYQGFSIAGKAAVTITANHVVPQSMRRGAPAVRLVGGTGSVPGSYAYESLNTSVMTASGDSVTAVAAGTATIKATFTPTDSTNYEARTVLHPITVLKALQTPVTLTLSRTTMDVNDSSTITTGGGSGTGLMAVVITDGPCFLQDSATVGAFDFGACSIRVEVEGDADYETAYSSIATLNVVDPNAVATPPSPPSPPVSGGSIGGGVSTADDKLETLTYSLSGTSITLKWSGNLTRVKISVVATIGRKQIIDVANGQFETTISDLIPGFAYTFTVTPVGGQSPSASKSLSIALKPRQPSIVSIEPTTPNELKVIWAADPGISKVKAILSAPNVETVTALSDGLSLSLAAKPGVSYSLELIAISSTDLVSESLIIQRTFIAAIEVKPTPDSQVKTSTSKSIDVKRTSVYLAPKSLKFTAKESQSLKSLKREVVKGRTITCTSVTSTKTLSPSNRSLALKQARAACAATVGSIKNVKQIVRIQWVKEARKPSRVSSSRTLNTRVDVLISRVVTDNASLN